VANKPIIPEISTNHSKIILQSLFGQFASLPGVMVVSNPRQAFKDWLTNINNNLDNDHDEAKRKVYPICYFLPVVFTTA
jgi:hypothetical protein